MSYREVPERQNRPQSGQKQTFSCIIWCAVSTSEQASEDKASLKQQENDARALAEREGWNLAAQPMVVPGHSRRYLDFNELAKDARQAGIDAFDRLSQHIKKRDFDILIVRDGDRFARTQALHAFITESVIDSGARIYSLADGWIDAANYRMWIAMGGYRSAGEIDKLIARRKMGMNKRAERGLPLSPYQILSHIRVRDEKGKVVKQVVNHDLDRLWQDLARLLLERVAFTDLEHELFTRFGHTDPKTGKPFTTGRMMRMLQSPTFWGNSGRHWSRNHYGHEAGTVPLFVIEAGHKIPDGVLMYYGTHEAVYDAETRERLKTEFTRRSEIGIRSASNRGRWYTSVFVCAECGFAMVGNMKRYLRCTTAVWFNRKQWHRATSCTNNIQTKIPYLKAWIDNALRQAVEHGIFTLYPPEQNPQDIRDSIQAIRAEIATLEAQAGRLITDKVNADPVFASVYDDKLAIIASALKTKRTALAALDLEQSAQSGTQQAQQEALDSLNKHSIDTFWTWDEKTQNRILLDLLGENRIAVYKGLIVGFTANRQKHGVRRKADE